MSQKMPILPVEAYTSYDWYRKEQELIFGNTWQFAGFIEDISAPGDYLTVQCGLQNIVIVKGRDQRLRAFHNLCRHRGTQLLRATGKQQKVITCPYHDWTYDLTGKLIGVPEKEKEFSDLDLDCVGLHKASVDVWRGMLWVHPSPEAEPINRWFKDCWEHLGPHDPTRLVEYPDTRYEKVIEANWKIVVENYIDVYHLAHLHSNTLHMYDHKNAEFGFVGDHYMFWEPLAPKYKDNLDKLIPYKRIEEVTDDVLGAFVPWLFPSVGLSENESAWSIFNVVPIAPDRTKVIVRSKLEPMTDREYKKHSSTSMYHWEKIMGSELKYDKNDPDDPMSSGDFMEEDIFACEQQQRSLSNPLFEVSHTAEFGERPIREFQKVIARWMQISQP